MIHLIFILNVTTLATGVFFVFHHFKKRSKVHAHTSCRNLPRGMSLMAGTDEPGLVLRQVQVLFRHGARTPLHIIPNIHQAEYKAEFIMKEHQASLFPYKRVSASSGKTPEWCSIHAAQERTPLKGGAYPGALSPLGKDQMHCLGRRLQSAYRDSLGLDSYDPNSVYLVSTNIRRTVESARCVLAGFFGRENLTEYAHRSHSPVLLNVTDGSNNYLIPDVVNCPLLRKQIMSALMQTENIAHMKNDRLKLEGHIESIRQSYINSVDEIQQKINKLHPGAVGFDKLAQDPQAQELLNERNRATENIAQLWSDVICRHPELGLKVSSDDMKALMYLKRLDVERMTGCKTGYRYTFHFETNPYVKNDVLVKEVYDSDQNLKTSPSWSTPVLWTPFGSLLPGREYADITPTVWLKYKMDEEERKAMQIPGNSGEEESPPGRLAELDELSQNTGNDKLIYDSQDPKSQSFFAWFVQLVSVEKDDIGPLIRDIMSDPLLYLQMEPPNEEFKHKNINFLFARDDFVCREVHGLPIPSFLKEYEVVIKRHATDSFHYAMTGQSGEEGLLITKLAVGQLLDTFLHHIKRKTQREEAYKLMMYSSHDTTMVALLGALGLWDQIWPPFNSDLRIELYETPGSGDYFVKVLYNGQAKKLRDQECELISLNEFEKTIKPYTIKFADMKEPCHVPSLQEMPKSSGESETGKPGGKPETGPGNRDSLPAGR